MNRLSLFISVLLLHAAAASAAPVTVEAARHTAALFMQQQAAAGVRRKAPAAREMSLIATGRHDSYYLFAHAGGEGFVVVSGDDATAPILGYSNETSLQADSMPCGMRVLLDSYARQIAILRDAADAAPAMSPRRAAAVQYILPATFRSTFDQHDPYNLLCGKCPRNDGDNCATGCTATAMAGLMYYHQWPPRLTDDIPAYTTETRGFAESGFAKGTAIEWPQIRSTYTPGNTAETGRDAVATLMKMAGTSIRTDYDHSSGAWSASVPYALRRYFGYEWASFEQSDGYDAAEWTAKLRNEITENGPVLYSGVREDGLDDEGKTKYVGHAFLLEGFDSDGLFYVNFGWGGSRNNMFRLDVLNSNGDYTYRYILNQSALFGVRPGSLEPMPVSRRLCTISVRPVGETVQSRQSQADAFGSVDVEVSVTDYMPDQAGHTYDVGFAYRKAGSSQYVIGQQLLEKQQFTLGSGYKVTSTLPFGSGLGDGQYDIFFTSRVSGLEEWTLNDNSARCHAQAWVCGNRMALRSATAHEADLTVAAAADTRVSPAQTATLTYTLRNSSPTDYDGAVLARLIYTDDGGNVHSAMAHIAEMHLGANSQQNLSVRLAVPSDAVSMEMQFLDRCWNPIGTVPVSTDDGSDPGPAPSYSGTAVAYWFDDQKEPAGVLQSPASAFMLDVSSLTEGLHALHLAVSSTDSDGEWRQEAPRTVYFEKHGQETELTTHYFIDGREHSTGTATTGAAGETTVPLANVGEGLYRLTTVIEHSGTQRLTMREDYFAREPSEKELAAMRMECSIDGVAPTTLQRAFTDGTLEYDLDVSQMEPGLHTLDYRVTGLVPTGFRRDVFVIDPRVDSFAYWLNGDPANAVVQGQAGAAMPWTLDALLPVAPMPLRTADYEFRVEEGIPVTYTVNDFTMRVCTDNGGYDVSETVKYVDEASRTAIGTELLPPNKTTTTAAPQSGSIKWMHLKATTGSIVCLQTDRPCTIRLYSPDGSTAYKAEGSAARAGGEVMAPLTGTYYVALHDVSDASTATALGITFTYTESNKETCDVNGDGSVNVADIATIIDAMAGVIPSGTALAASADVNGDGSTDVADIATVIDRMAELARMAKAY